MLFTVLSILSLVLLTVYFVSRRKFDYWKKQNVPYLEPTTIFGNYGDYILMRQFMGKVVHNILQKFPDEPYVGAYYGTEPTLIVHDPEIIKLVTTKDFYYFHGREASNYSHKELVTQNLFSESGDNWKVSRQNLTPLFSSSKMKNMFYLIKKCSIEFEKVLDKEVSMSNELDCRKLMPRYTMACFCSCAFGVEIDTLRDDYQQNSFIQIGDAIFDASTVRGVALMARAIWPAIFYGVGLTLFPNKLNTFFKSLLTQVFESRQYKPTSRNDFVDLLLQLKQNKVLTGDSIHNFQTREDKKIEISVTENFMIAQCFIFFAAGFETSATTLTHTLFELAKHPEAQKKAQADVDNFLKKHDNDLVYDCLTELPYLEACVDEALRLYPVLSVLNREVMADYTLPSGVTLHKGVRVHIPVYSIHRNPKYFPEPLKYRPERFLPEERQNIKSHTYLPFGDGGRFCIGRRFAKMQMLAGLVTLLKKYTVKLADGMKTTLEFDPRGAVSQPYGGINLKFIERDNWEARQFTE